MKEWFRLETAKKVSDIYLQGAPGCAMWVASDVVFPSERESSDEVRVTFG